MEKKCPRCGSRLHVPDAAIWDWQTAPLLCDVCLQGYWLAELEPSALLTYDAKNRTHRVPARVAAKKERALAQLRGHGISKDVQALLSTRQLELAKRRGVIS